ncbi:MAG: hypothetical protein ACSHWS_15390 [Sulfitobacter sp.]
MKWFCALVVTICSATVLAAQSVYMDNPGFCTADEGDQELADISMLGPNGIYSHALSCEWDRRLDYVAGLDTTVMAKCDGQDGPFTLEVEIFVNENGRVIAFGRNDSMLLPGFYFPCDRWGYRG